MALSGGMVSSCHWGCGAVAARALQGEEEKGGGGRLDSAGESPGTQETGRQTKELRSGAEAPGSRRAAMAEPGAAQTPETAEPCGGIPATELRPSYFTPPPPYVPLHGVPRCRGAQEFGAQCAEGVADGCDTAINRGIEGTTFLPHHFPQPPAFPSPSTTFFCILPHHATRGDQRHFRGRFRSHPRTSGCT